MGRRNGTVLAFVFSTASLTLSGCYSDSPLDSSPQVQLDPALLGSWRCVSADPDSANAATVTFAVVPGKEREYHLTWQEPEKEADAYRAYISSVRGAMFLNVRPLEESTHAGWAFFRYSFPRSNILYAEFVREEPFKDKRASASPAAARATLETALRAKPDALQEFCVCLRAPDGRSKKDNELSSNR